MRFKNLKSFSISPEKQITGTKVTFNLPKTYISECPILRRLEMVWLDYFKRHSSGTQSSLIWLLLILRSVKSISGWKKNNHKHIAYVHLKGLTEFLLFSTQYHTVSIVLSRVLLYLQLHLSARVGVFFYIHVIYYL